MDGSKGRAFVLLSGGGMGAWIWERLIPLLDYPGVAVDRRTAGDPRRATLRDCAAHAAEEMRRASVREAILVAHSGSGILAPLVPAETGAVRRIVFLSAAIPADGANIQQGLPLAIRIANTLAIRLNSKPFPARRMEKTIREKFCNDSPEDVVRDYLERDVMPEPPRVLSERVRRGSLPRVPGSYVRFLDDRSLPQERMERMAANYGCDEFLECPGDHMAMLGRPRELAEVLNRIARGEWGTGA